MVFIGYSCQSSILGIREDIPIPILGIYELKIKDLHVLLDLHRWVKGLHSFVYAYVSLQRSAVCCICLESFIS